MYDLSLSNCLGLSWIRPRPRPRPRSRHGPGPGPSSRPKPGPGADGYYQLINNNDNIIFVKYAVSWDQMFSTERNLETRIREARIW